MHFWKKWKSAGRPPIKNLLKQNLLRMMPKHDLGCEEVLPRPRHTPSAQKGTKNYEINFLTSGQKQMNLTYLESCGLADSEMLRRCSVAWKLTELCFHLNQVAGTGYSSVSFRATERRLSISESARRQLSVHVRLIVFRPPDQKLISDFFACFSALGVWRGRGRTSSHPRSCFGIIPSNFCFRRFLIGGLPADFMFLQKFKKV